MTIADAQSEKTARLYRGIAIRNIWLLLLYASELFPEIAHKRKNQGKEETPDDLLDVIAEILVHYVRERLMRGLTRSSMSCHADMSRVRGSIDMLRTERRQLLAKGLVACRFQEPTLNTPRNRLIKFALEKGAQLPSESQIRKKCRNYASLLYRMGVVGDFPDRATLSKEVYGINDKDDRQAVAAAKLLLDMAMPDDQTGSESLLSPDASDKWLRKLFEHAIRGFYGVVASEWWFVSKGNVPQDWPATDFFENTEQHLPKMKLDVVLESKNGDKKIVIDTKFTSILKPGWYRDQSLSSAYIYQMYAYLRSQEESGKCLDKNATGILLHPVTEKSEKFSLTMQGHRFIFATVNLNAQPTEIRRELLELIQS